MEGSKSIWLWKKGAAPLIFREESHPITQGPDSGQKVKITVLRWMGWKDFKNPNNESVQLELASQSPTDMDISGYTLKNLKGDSFMLPKGSTIRSGVPFRIIQGWVLPPGRRCI